ncbi:hypothetical protein K7432_009455 [Basidiobolus ranarum]|uniref:Uncharacterized protein n=1 Tax=Basidiobolus ranarum TaxID=34480 RepID=A0ABR2VX18_9FUNG
MRLFNSKPSLKRHSSSPTPSSPTESDTEEIRDFRRTTFAIPYSDKYQRSFNELETFLDPTSLSKCTLEEKLEYAKIAFLLDQSLQSFLKNDTVL